MMNKSIKPVWYNEKQMSSNYCEDNMSKYSGNSIGSLDENIRKFIVQCDDLVLTLDKITKLQDKPRYNSELYDFKKKVLEVRDGFIVEAYNRSMLDWN